MSVWDDLVGQDAAVQVLRTAVANAQPSAMSHAWLITGPPGSGRSNAARAFAAALQCEQGGCGVCHDCRTVFGGNHPDVTAVATQKVTISIDEVRQLVTLAAGSPSGGKWRVIIIEDADRMVERTSNVLLKSIEEPAPRTVWLLCAPSPQDVIVTIRSRCRPLQLRIPSVESVTNLLVERDGVDPERAKAATLAAQNHIGMAKRLATSASARERRHTIVELAGMIRGVGDAVISAGKLMEIATSDAKADSETRDAEEKADLLRMLGADEAKTVPAHIRSQVRQLEEEQKRRATRAQRDVLDRALLDILSLYRDVLVKQLGHSTLNFNIEHDEIIERIAAATRAEETLQKMDAIGQARTRLAANSAPLLTLEALAVALRVP